MSVYAHILLYFKQYVQMKEIQCFKMEHRSFLLSFPGNLYKTRRHFNRMPIIRLSEVGEDPCVVMAKGRNGAGAGAGRFPAW